MEISFSKNKTWGRCLRQYYYKYELNLERKLASLPASKGKLIHSCLEAYYRGGYEAVPGALKEYKKGLSKFFDEERVLYQEIPGEVARIVRGYHNYWRDHKNFRVLRDKQGPLIERELLVPIAKDLELKVIIDLVVEDNVGLWVMDHKSCKTLPGDDFRLTDTQSALYVSVLRGLGYTPAGMMWNYIRTKAPTMPQLTQTGRLSKARIDTDRSTYLSAIKKYGLDPEDYRDTIKSLTYKTFFTRVRLPKPDAMVKNVLEELIVNGNVMKIYKGKPAWAFTRSFHKACDWDCEFRSLCITDLLGHDTEYMIKTHYQERRKDDGEEIEEETPGY